MQITALQIAQKWIGITELPGRVNNIQISAWIAHASVGQMNSSESFPDEIYWCGAFIHGVVFPLGLPIPDIPIRARAWLTVGRKVELKDAKPGFDIAILNRGGASDPKVLKGPAHVGFLHHIDHSIINLVGGNQGNAVSISSFPISSILEIRRLYEE